MLNVPVNLLRVFEVAARTGSFRTASSQLGLTPSAISHAVRKLEETLGVPLFERAARSVRLTYEGEVLMRHVGRAFDDLRRGMEAVSARAPTLLRLHCAPSFAAQWLTPRLPSFLEAHPGTDVRLAAGTDYTRFTSDEFDADIVYGAPRAEGLVVMPLGEETITPVCSPALAASIRDARDLLGLSLIQSDTKQVQWSDWFAAQGVTEAPRIGSRFDRSFLAILAAAQGLGVALESTRLVEAELASGRLVAPLAERSRPVRYVGHYLVHPRHTQPRKTLRQFSDWLQQQLRLAPIGAEGGRA